MDWGIIWTAVGAIGTSVGSLLTAIAVIVAVKNYLLLTKNYIKITSRYDEGQLTLRIGNYSLKDITIHDAFLEYNGKKMVIMIDSPVNIQQESYIECFVKKEQLIWYSKGKIMTVVVDNKGKEITHSINTNLLTTDLSAERALKEFMNK